MTTYPNWFEMTARPYFERHLLPLAGKPGLRFLQIGVFTGDASVWLLDNVLTGEGSQLIDVDTWEGSGEAAHEAFDWPDVVATYNAHVFDARRAGRVFPIQKASTDYLRAQRASDVFDFIYIDGDHTAPAVLADAVGAFPLLKLGGLMAFDDYLWKADSGRGVDAPGVAVDSFVDCYGDQLELLEPTWISDRKRYPGDQVWVRRTA